MKKCALMRKVRLTTRVYGTSVSPLGEGPRSSSSEAMQGSQGGNTQLRLESGNLDILSLNILRWYEHYIKLKSRLASMVIENVLCTK